MWNSKARVQVLQTSTKSGGACHAIHSNLRSAICDLRVRIVAPPSVYSGKPEFRMSNAPVGELGGPRKKVRPCRKKVRGRTSGTRRSEFQMSELTSEIWGTPRFPYRKVATPDTQRSIDRTAPLPGFMGTERGPSGNVASIDMLASVDLHVSVASIAWRVRAELAEVSIRVRPRSKGAPRGS